MNTRETALQWIRDHLVASLLIVAGLGAIGQYAAGSLFSSPTTLQDLATTGRKTREGVRAIAKAVVAHARGSREEADEALIVLEDVLETNVDPDLEKLGRETANRLRQWRSYNLSPATTVRPRSLDEIIDQLDELSPQFKSKYGDAYR